LRFDVYPISSSIGKKSEFWIGGNIIPLLYVIYIYPHIFGSIFYVQHHVISYVCLCENVILSKSCSVIHHFIPTGSWSTHGGKTPIFRHITGIIPLSHSYPQQNPYCCCRKTVIFPRLSHHSNVKIFMFFG
jgi:hypothetical protein